MTGGKRTFFVHIGTRKTGTTRLQRSLSMSRTALREQGVAMPFVDWSDHRRSLGDPLLLCRGHDSRAADARETLRLSAARCRTIEGDRLLASYEELAELDEETIRELAELFDDFDVRIIVTTRHWGATIPSEWQQAIKEHLVLAAFPDYLAEIGDQTGIEAERFRRRHDVVGIVERWGSVFGTDRIDVIALPAHVTDPGLLTRLYGSLVGFDPATLRDAPKAANSSLSYAAAETLRRVHVLNRDQLPHYMAHFRSYDFRMFLHSALERASGPPAQIPVEYRGWCEGVARAQVTALQQSGCRVSGDLNDLIPTDWPDPVPPPGESEICEVAVSLAADLTLRLVNESGEPRQAGDEGARSRPPSSRPRDRLRGILRRARNRLPRLG